MRRVSDAHIARVLAKHKVIDDPSAWMSLARRVLKGWEEMHGARFPDGSDVSLNVGQRLERSVRAEWEAVGGENAFIWGRRQSSRRTLTILAQCLRLPQKWRNADSQESRAKRRQHRYVTPAGTKFDATTTRYAVYADVLTAEQVQDARGLPERVRYGKGASRLHMVNRFGESSEESDRMQWYCGGTHLPFNCAQILVKKGILDEGYSQGTATHTASIIYTRRKTASAENQQQWHTDFDPDLRDGADHISVIFALDDNVTVPIIGDASLVNPLPPHNKDSPPTLKLPVPKGGCVLFRGDTIHAGMRDKGRSIRRMHVYLAKGTARYVDEVADNKAYFVA